MIKQLTRISLGLLLVGSVACSKKVKEDPNEGAAISSESMNFNAMGSDSGTIDGLKTVNFAYDSAVITGAARETLKNNAAWIKTNSRVSVQIEGHCDSRGSVEYNLALGERRAQAVRNYLVSLGVAGNVLSIISYGKEKPLENGDSEAVHARNRRANFVPQSN